MIRSYVDFNLHVQKLKGEGYFVHARAGEKVANGEFESPLTEDDLEALREADSARFAREVRARPHRSFSAETLGRSLYQKVITGPIRSLLTRHLPRPLSTRGVRLLLHSDSPEALRWPWELLHNSLNFLALSHDTPVVRHLEFPNPFPILRTPYPLRILVVVASPSGLTPLDSEGEIKEIRRAFRWFIRLGIVKVERLASPTLADLFTLLGKKAFHVLHFIGHGKFESEHGRGVIFFEDQDGRPHPVSGARLAAILAVDKTLRLVVLNSCEGALGGEDDRFTGVAQGLIGVGIPAVVAMQFPIEDPMAVVFSYWFYWALARGRRVEWAVTRARIALRAAGKGFDWAVPVLYLSTPDGRLFRWRPSWPAVLSTVATLLLGAWGWLAIPRDTQIMLPSDPTSPPPRFCRPPQALPDLKLILVRPGTFKMGSEAGEDDERPVHEVALTKPFCLGEYEVTQKEWETVTGSGLRTQLRGDSLPVSKVSYEEVQEFFRKLNEPEGWSAFRLPSEAEWEHVASAPGTSDGNCLGSGADLVPVGSLPANALGFHGLIGNVWEMTGDWYGPYPKGPLIDPVGPSSGVERVVRGGSSGSAEKHCRPTRRETRKPTSQYKDTGFRIARDLRR